MGNYNFKKKISNKNITNNLSIEEIGNKNITNIEKLSNKNIT